MSFPNERRLISIFRNFVEKTMVPQIRKNQGSLVQWNKFLGMITLDSINYNQLNMYVDTLPNLNISNTFTPNPINFTNDKNNILKKNEELDNLEVGFNPNKTFGGERSKVSHFGSSQENNDNRRQSQRQESMRNRNQQPKASVLISLQKLMKNLEQNQLTIQSSEGGNNRTLQKNPIRTKEPQTTPIQKRNTGIVTSNNKSISRPSNSITVGTPSNYGNTYNNNFTQPYNYQSNHRNSYF